MLRVCRAGSSGVSCCSWSCSWRSLALVAANRRDDGDRDATPPAPRRATGAADHLRALQRIATAGGGTRAAGTPGDRATAAYIAARLRAAGYRVSTQSFEVPFYRERKPPRVVVGGAPGAARSARSSSPPAAARPAACAPVGLGCAARDYGALQAGEIALARRGDCFFFQKALRARQAGAAAMLVVNDGPRPTPGSLFRAGPGIPVVGLSKSAGAGLAGQRATVAVDAVSSAAADDERDRRDRACGRGARGDGRRAPRLGPRRPGDERQRQRRRRAAHDRRAHPRAPAPARQRAAARLLGRRGARPARLAPLRQPARERRATPDRRVPEPRHGRQPGSEAGRLRRRARSAARRAPAPCGSRPPCAATCRRRPRRCA